MRRSALLLFLLICVFLWPQMAEGECSCRGTPRIWKDYKRSAAVFAAWGDSHEAGSTGEAVLRVTESWKGLTMGTEAVTVLVDADCPFEFSAREHYLVYAYRQEDSSGDGLLVSGCSRTRLSREALHDMEILGLPAWHVKPAW